MAGFEAVATEPQLNMSELVNAMVNSFPPEARERLFSIVDLTYIAAIIILAILIASLIKKIIEIFTLPKTAKSLAKIADNTAAISEKLDKRIKPSRKKEKEKVLKLRSSS